MFPSKALLSLILLTLTAVHAISVDRRTGKDTLGFTTRIKELGSQNVLEKDLARVQTLKQGGQLAERSVHIAGITNQLVNYVANVGVGSPPTDYTLLIDTGSSNTFVGAGKPYVQTETSHDTGHSVSVSYGSGSFSGEEWIDTVTLTTQLVIDQQSIGVASSATGFSPDDDGILGVGPVSLTRGTVNGVDEVPTVMDNLASQGKISSDVLGVYFIPATEPTKSGELTFGGYDPSATIDPVVYFPVTGTSPASQYWGIDQSISYGTNEILSTTAGIVDTGSTLILLATDAFQRYQSLTGGVPDDATGLLKITPAQYAALQPLVFNVGNVPFVLPPNGQIWPRSLNERIGGRADGIYLIVSDLKSPSGSGLDFVNGYTFLERFYSVYDATNNRVGLAATRYTLSDIN